ncbi:MAG: sulfatase [Akkermansiaceae bacterium]
MRFLILSLLLILPAAAKKPNILWIFSEDLSPYFGCYGDAINKDHTPVVDQFAKDGVLFKRAFMPAPVCSACRSAMITGVYQTTTGTHQHRSSRFTDGEIVPENLRIHLPKGMKTIPELMRESGYFTFNCGKDDYNFHYDRRTLYTIGTDPKYKVGMNGWQGNKDPNFKDWTQSTWRGQKDKDRPWFGQMMIWGGKANARHVRKGHLLQPNDVPIPPYFPDHPAHRKAWTTHYNAARGVDQQIEEILALLKADGELENTIIFFFSDHGNNQSLRHKQFCYEGGVHVPLIIKGDHPALKAGTVRDDLVLGLDISATTLALGGVKLPDYLDGVDLFAEDHKPRTHVIAARDRCDYTIDRIRTVRTEKLRYLKNYHLDRPMLQAQYRDHRPPVLTLKALHKAGKLTPYQKQHWFGDRPAEELYDLAKDPYQVNNLAGDPAYAAELKHHRALLEKWIKESGDKGHQPEDAAQLKATFDLWIERPIFRDAKVNPEYDQFR